MASMYMRGDIVSNVRDAGFADFASLHLQNIRRLHITIEVLDKNNRVIETLHGLSNGGSINIEGESLIRRTGSLSFVLFDYLMPHRNSMLWMTNKIRIYAGIEDTSSTTDMIHFCLGTFYITEPSVSVGKDSRSIDISLEDNMLRWDQEQLENEMIIEAGVPIHTAIEQLMNKYGEFNTEIQFSDLTVPYDLEFPPDNSVLDVVTAIRDLYMDWECFYDVDGTFVFRKKKIQREHSENPSWVFDKSGDLITDFKESFTYKDVKNRVVVIGAIDERTGVTPRAEASIVNPDSPFHQDEIEVRTKVITESSYGTVEQCESRARYELFKSSTFQEQVSISCIPIYFLDANHIIEIKNPVTKDNYRYVIDSISIGLGVEDEMSITAYKVYYDHFTESSNLDKYRKSADIIINGITNKGWLSLAEQRISDYYGLDGDMSKLIVRFEHQTKYGVTAYTTGYFGEKTQSITIDLADFENSAGDSGDNGTGKAEYSDRVLGHEMVHVLMNNVFSVEKTSGMPIWFKEGSSEFIHGADERLKGSIVKNGAIDDTLLNNLINRASNMMRKNFWESVSDDYSASYIILKFIDNRMKSSNKTMVDLMNSIRISTEGGDVAVKEAVAKNTGFSTFEDFVSYFDANIKQYVRLGIKLDIGRDEVDTGSIAGTDHRGSLPLNAENVFDNSKATKGIPLKGFSVIFQRP